MANKEIIIAPARANTLLAIIIVGIIRIAETIKSLAQRCLLYVEGGRAPKETMETKERLSKELQIPTTKVNFKIYIKHFTRDKLLSIFMNEKSIRS